MVTRSERSSDLELFMGFRIRQRGTIFMAIPLDWSQGRAETIVASDLETLREEIRRWWHPQDS